MGRPVPSRRWAVAVLLSTTLVATIVAAACSGTGQATAPAATSPPPTQDGPAAPTLVPDALSSASAAALSPATPSPSAAHVPLTALPAFTPGSLTTTDADGDGTAEAADYVFPTEQVAPDLTLDRTLAVRTDGSAVRSDLELTFRYTGTGPTSHAFTLEIPKEMAASIDDIDFSIPPTRIVDVDPLVEWNLDLGAAATSVIIVTVATADEDWQLVPGPVGIVLATRLAACKPLPDEQRAACTLEVAREFRDAGPLEEGLDETISRAFPWDCENLADTPSAAFSRAACFALFKGAGACASLSDPGERALCHAYLAEADCELKKAGAPRDRCLFERAVAGGSTFACALIDGADARALCEAGVTKSEDACRRLSAPDLVERCLAALAKGETPTATLLEPPPVEDVDPDWFPVAKQDTPCLELAAGLSGWKMGKAKNRKPSTLDCWFEAAKPDRTKNIGILVLPGDAEARAQFAKCCGQSPPGSAAGGGKTEGVEKERAWDGERFSRALGFTFAGLTGGAWVDGRWSDEYLVIERYRNCLIAIMTTIDYEAPPGKAPSPPALSAAVDAETVEIIDAAKKIIDEHLE